MLCQSWRRDPLKQSQITPVNLVQCPGCWSVVLVPHQPLLPACTSQIQKWSSERTMTGTVPWDTDGHLQSSKKGSSRDQSHSSHPPKAPLVKNRAPEWPWGSFSPSLPCSWHPAPSSLTSQSFLQLQKEQWSTIRSLGITELTQPGPPDTGTVLGLSQTHALCSGLKVSNRAGTKHEAPAAHDFIVLMQMRVGREEQVMPHQSMAVSPPYITSWHKYNAGTCTSPSLTCPGTPQEEMWNKSPPGLGSAQKSEWPAALQHSHSLSFWSCRNAPWPGRT